MVPNRLMETWRKIRKDPAGQWEYFRFISGLGEGQIGFIKGWFQISQVGTFMVVVALYAPEYTNIVLAVVPAFLVCYVLGRAFLGYKLDKTFKLQHRAIAINNERNITLQTIARQIDSVENRLRRMEKGDHT